MNITLAELLNYIFGSTTLVSIYIAWQSRKSEIKKAETTALDGMQIVYDKFVTQTEKEFEKLKKIIETQELKIKELEDLIKNNKKCKNCIEK